MDFSKSRLSPFRLPEAVFEGFDVILNVPLVLQELGKLRVELFSALAESKLLELFSIARLGDKLAHAFEEILKKLFVRLGIRTDIALHIQAHAVNQGSNFGEEDCRGGVFLFGKIQPDFDFSSMLQSDCSLRLSRISLLSGFQKQGDQLFAGKT